MLTTELEKPQIKRRSKGERTKQKILNSAIEVLAQQGVKGTTHRAVAKVAGIQLSLTTYYFKDIEELIYQAITLNSNNLQRQYCGAWLTTLALIESYSKLEIKKISVKNELVEKLSEQLLKISTHFLQTDANALSVEQILFSQTHIYPKLLCAAEYHKKALILPITKLCQYVNKKTATLNAELLFTVIKQQEYQLLTQHNEDEIIKQIQPVFSHCLALILKSK